MATEIVPYAPERFALVRDFAEATWTRPRSEAHYRWRYEEAPDTRAFLALHDGVCLAMGSACRRTYRLGDERVDFLETFDWYTRPGVRNAGLGVRIIQRFMQEPEPLLLVGGSQDAMDLLARLKWKRVCTAERFILPLPAGVADGVQRRLRLPARPAAWLARASHALRGPRAHAAPAGGRVVPVARVGEEVHALYRGATSYGTLVLWTPERLRWLLGGFPGSGHYVPLYFARGDALLGWALLRVYPTDAGAAAEIVDLLEPRADADLYAWMVTELVRVAVGFGAQLVGATTSCPAVASALRAHRFVPAGDVPVHAWIRDGRELPGPHLLGSNTRDTAINPFPKHWWGEEMAR